MKQITALVRPFRAEAVLKVVGELDVNACLVQEAKGYSRQKGYLERYRDNIAKVTKEDVLRVAKAYLHPENMVMTVVGDGQKFDQPLTTLGPVRKIVLENGK